MRVCSQCIEVKASSLHGTTEAEDLKVRANTQHVGLRYHSDVEAVLSHSRSMLASSRVYTRRHMSQGSEPLA